MDEKELEKKLSRLKNIKPSDRLVNKIILGYNQPAKGRISFSDLIFNQIQNLMKWGIVIPLLIVVLAIIVFGATYFTGSENAGEYSFKSGAEKVVVPEPQSTGNVDDAINAVLDFSSAEDILFADEENDAALINIDNQEINDFGQSYDENQL